MSSGSDNNTDNTRDMLGRGKAISVEHALELILKNTPQTPQPVEDVSLEHAYGRVLASEMLAPEDMPGFARSTVDGYAVRAADTFGASETGPAYLKITHEILMGQEPDFELAPGKAANIATGGMLPRGADTVLMFEHSQLLEDVLEAHRALAPGDNVIQKGEDVSAGSLIVSAGERLTPYAVSAAAGLGVVNIKAHARPRVSIISTGDEIVPPETNLKPGQIRDSNSYALRGMVADEDCVPKVRGIFKDDFGAILEEMKRSVKESEAVLITGGSSVGTKDMAERVISELGEVVFHGVTIKPGKPLLFGVIDGTPVFGLPGHPRAVQVCFEVFVLPALYKLSGLETDKALENELGSVSARLTKSIHSVQGREDIIPVRLSLKDGELFAEPLMSKSGLLLSMVRAHGAFSIEVGSTGMEKGEAVSVRLR
ncbi:MAG: molybdopterin molybdotransferase MoeA [Thermodesulfovibrionales bacterium]|nr:molybdopterin molybdotransferase MoeA [Thermodesulfovibrionales bacterium]